MIIKHYTSDKTLCIIDNITDVWVHQEDKPTISREMDFFAYIPEDLEKLHKVVSFVDKNNDPKVLRIHEGITVYICSDNGDTIEKVVG